MSQNGAKAMADMGKEYNEILKHYYSGVEIVIYMNKIVINIREHKGLPRCSLLYLHTILQYLSFTSKNLPFTGIILQFYIKSYIVGTMLSWQLRYIYEIIQGGLS